MTSVDKHDVNRRTNMTSVNTQTTYFYIDRSTSEIVKYINLHSFSSDCETYPVDFAEKLVSLRFCREVHSEFLLALALLSVA